MPYSDNFWILLDSFTQMTPSLSGVVVQKLLAFGIVHQFQAIPAFSCKCHLVTSAGFRSLSILAMISSRFSPLGIESL